MRKSARIAALLFALPGVFAPFLPFVAFFGTISPLEVVVSFLIHRDDAWALALLGTPFFLAIPIAIWQARRVFADGLSALEVTASYVLSAAAMIATLPWMIGILLDIKNLSALPSHVAMMSPFWAFFVANIVLLWRNVAKRMTRECTAEVFLLGAYLPNAVYCLIAFGRYSPVQIGAWVVLIACISYLISIVLALRTEPRSPASVSGASLARYAG